MGLAEVKQRCLGESKDWTVQQVYSMNEVLKVKGKPDGCRFALASRRLTGPVGRANLPPFYP